MCLPGKREAMCPMRVEKRIIDHIEKCYAVTKFEYNNQEHLLCSAEGMGPCHSYDLQGNLVETIFDGPGGVMTLLQVPDISEPVLLATQGFYSPDNASEGKIVYYCRKENQWHCNILCDLPFIHRFGIVRYKEKKYLMAATLKSACAFEGDWTCPGRIWAAEFPENIFLYHKDNPLKLEPIFSGLYKNHGFSINEEKDYSYGIVGTEQGVYTVYPPGAFGDGWKIECILEEPVSDMLYRDFDGEGEKELLILSPFHGDAVKIYKKDDKGRLIKVYEREKKLSFAHAIWGGRAYGWEYAFLGGRGGGRELIALSYDKETGQYSESLLDTGAGAANCMLFQTEGGCILLAANRETDEVAVYNIKNVK